ncbi:sulfotransferase family protein [candidate division KSB1 bacterium]|nr:sulfotransferase family protein [candidate division KSB1 bacterium]
MITIVSGLPRSGTSLMMQMLEKGGMEVLSDQIRKPDENNVRGYNEYEKVRSLPKDPSWIIEAEGKVVKIIAQLLFFLPRKFEYRILFMERNMDEIIESQSKMLQNLGTTGAKLDPAILIQTFQKQMDQAKAIITQAANIEWIPISYNEILTDPAPTAEKVNVFLGNSLIVQDMASVVDATLYRTRC